MFSQRVGAFIASALSALNIFINSYQKPVQDVFNYLSDPYDVIYTYPDYDIKQYYDKSTVVIHPQTVMVDGVEYDDIWFSHDAAEKFRVNAFDIVSAKNLASESSGTFVSGAGSIRNFPLYKFPNNVIKSQEVQIPVAVGTYYVPGGTITQTAIAPIMNRARFDFLDGTNAEYTFSTSSDYYVIQFQVDNNLTSGTIKSRPVRSGTWSELKTLSNQYYDLTPFDFDYTSGTIPAEQDFSQDDGLHLLVPHSQSQGIQDFVDENPEFAQPDGVEINLDVDPSLEAKLDDLIDLIIPLIPVINADFSDVNHYVDPQPVPEETISNTDYSILNQTLQDIRQDIQSIPSAIQEIISSIPTKLDSIIQAIGNIGNTILQEIEEGPIRLARKAIDSIKSIFLPILISLKNAIGIWHYVVEWFTAISSPFAWFRGVMASSSPSLLVPVYASIAGFIVIAVYRRFGR